MIFCKISRRRVLGNRRQCHQCSSHNRVYFLTLLSIKLSRINWSDKQFLHTYMSFFNETPSLSQVDSDICGAQIQYKCNSSIKGHNSKCIGKICIQYWYYINWYSQNIILTKCLVVKC